MANNQKLSPQGYNIQDAPVNDNPLWKLDEGGGGNVPAGGSAGQVLTKRTDVDYDTVWADPTGGGGGVTPAQVQTIVDQNLDPVKSNISAIEAEQETQNTGISDNASAISSLDIRVTNVSGYAENIYNELNGRTTTLEFRADEDSERLDSLEALTTQHSTDITGLRSDLTGVSNSLNGGTAGQLLSKTSATDKDFRWIDPPESSGVTLAQVRAITDPIDARVTTNADDIEDLQTRLSPVESSLTALQTQLLQAQEDIQTNVGNIDTHTTEIYNLTTRVTNHDATIEANTTEISNLGTALDSVESDLNSVKASFNALNNATNGTGEVGQVLTRTGTGANEFDWETLTIPPDLSGNVSTIENTLAALEPRVETLETTVDSHTTRLDTYEVALEAVTQRTNPLVTAGVIGQVLTKTGSGDTGYTWQDPPSGGGGITPDYNELLLQNIKIRGRNTTTGEMVDVLPQVSINTTVNTITQGAEYSRSFSWAAANRTLAILEPYDTLTAILAYTIRKTGGTANIQYVSATFPKEICASDSGWGTIRVPMNTPSAFVSIQMYFGSASSNTIAISCR